MKSKILFNPLDNNSGFVLVVAMVILLILIVVGTTAIRMTSTEFQIAANDRFIKEDFYNQETCKTTGLFNYRTWLTAAYLTASESSAFFPPTGGTDANTNGINDAAECTQGATVTGSFKVRNIETTQATINGWEDNADFSNSPKHPANDFPKLDHKDKPDPGTGYDPKNFTIRRFVITSYSPGTRQKVILQEGANKVFNSY